MPENFIERPRKNEKDDAIQYVKSLLTQAREDNRNEDIEKLEELVRLLHTKKYDYINVSRHSRFLSGVSFFARKSKVSLKISLKFPLALFDYSEGCFANCLLNSIFGIDICLCD